MAGQADEARLEGLAARGTAVRQHLSIHGQKIVANEAKSTEWLTRG
jgi:hypothetical protein